MGRVWEDFVTGKHLFREVGSPLLHGQTNGILIIVIAPPGHTSKLDLESIAKRNSGLKKSVRPFSMAKYGQYTGQCQHIYYMLYKISYSVSFSNLLGFFKSTLPSVCIRCGAVRRGTTVVLVATLQEERSHVGTPQRRAVCGGDVGCRKQSAMGPGPLGNSILSIGLPGPSG